MSDRQVTDEQENTKHKSTKSTRGRKNKQKKRENVREAIKNGTRPHHVNMKAYSFQSVVAARRVIQRQANALQRAARLPYVARYGDYPPPDLVAVIGPKGVGKTTLTKALVRVVGGYSVSDPIGPITVVASKTKRITFYDVPASIPAILDISKLVNLVIIVVNAKVGLEVEHYEYLNILQATGFPRVFTVFTHLDEFSKARAMRNEKVRLRERIWKEVYPGSRVFYMNGLAYGRTYHKTDMALLARILSRQEYKLGLNWRDNHAGVLIDRIEDITDPGLLSKVNQEKNKLVKHKLLVYGYVRGTYMDPAQHFCIPGAGNVIVKSMKPLPDPCRCFEQQKKDGDARRSLSSKTKTVYAPFSNMGDVFHDKDGLWLRIHETGVQWKDKDEDELPAGLKMLRNLEELDPQEKDKAMLGIRLMDDSDRELDSQQHQTDEPECSSEADTKEESISQQQDKEHEEEIGQSSDEEENAFLRDAQLVQQDSSAKQAEHGNDHLSFEESSENVADIDYDMMMIGRKAASTDSDSADTAADSVSASEPGNEPSNGEAATEEMHALADDVYASIRLATPVGAKIALEDLVYNMDGILAEMKAKGVSPAMTRTTRSAAVMSKLVPLFDDDGPDLYRGSAVTIDKFSLLPIYDPEKAMQFDGLVARSGGSALYTGVSLAGKNFYKLESYRDISNVIPKDVVYSQAFTETLQGSSRKQLSGLHLADIDWKRTKNSVCTGDWDMAKILDAVLHGEVYKGKEHRRDGSGGVHVAEDGVLEIGYQAAPEQDTTEPTHQAGLEYTLPRSKHGKHTNQSVADKKLANDANELLEGLELNNDGIEKNQREMDEAKERESAFAKAFTDESRFPPGTYLRIELEGIDHEFAKNYASVNPLVLGVVLPGEQNYGYITAKVKRHRWHDKILKTKNPVFVSCGWKRYQTVPYYSMEQQGSMADINTDEVTEAGRHRMLKYTPENMYCYCTFWGPIVPANTGFLFFDTVDDTQRSFRIGATGTVVNTGLKHMVYKKLKLVGAVNKVFRNTAFIEKLFTSKLEAMAFIGAGIRTVSGIRGIIKKAEKQPEGLVRATFEDKVAHSDIVFLRTYVPITIIKFCYEMLNHYYVYDDYTREYIIPGEKKSRHEQPLRIKTFAELRHERNLPIPINPDSIYVQKTARVVDQFIEDEHRDELLNMVPTRLLKSLPFENQREIVIAKNKPDLIKDEFLKSLADGSGAEHEREKVLNDLLVVKKDQDRKQLEMQKKEEEDKKIEEEIKAMHIREKTKELRKRKRIVRQKHEEKRISAKKI